jgi:hypothetical protein
LCKHFIAFLNLTQTLKENPRIFKIKKHVKYVSFMYIHCCFVEGYPKVIEVHDGGQESTPDQMQGCSFRSTAIKVEKLGNNVIWHHQHFW